MSYGETKVYFDGSHYIAIHHTTRPKRYKPKKCEELITIVQEEDGSITEVVEPSLSFEENFSEKTQKNDENIEKSDEKVEKTKKIVTNVWGVRKGEF